jgi:NAD(P)-dependent dehydrogenase (short-subunit alcohol dehydrogenase family)
MKNPSDFSGKVALVTGAGSGMGLATALEHATNCIRVNAVCPGPIDTPIARAVVNWNEEALAALVNDVPMRRLGKVEEVASFVLWLCGRGRAT